MSDTEHQQQHTTSLENDFTSSPSVDPSLIKIEEHQPPTELLNTSSIAASNGSLLFGKSDKEEVMLSGESLDVFASNNTSNLVNNSSHDTSGLFLLEKVNDHNDDIFLFEQKPEEQHNLPPNTTQPSSIENIVPTVTVFEKESVLTRKTYTGKVFWSGVQEIALRDNKRVFDELSSQTIKSKTMKFLDDASIKPKIMKDGKLDSTLIKQILGYLLQQTEPKAKKKSKKKTKKEFLDFKAKILLQITECVIETNFKNNANTIVTPAPSTFSVGDDNGDEDAQPTVNEKIVEFEKELEVVWKKSNLVNYLRVPSYVTNLVNKKVESIEEEFVLDMNEKVYNLLVENSELGFGLIFVLKNVVLLSLRNSDLVDEVKQFCTDAKEEGPLVEILLEELFEEKKLRIKNEGADISAFGENPKEEAFLRKCFEHLARIKDKEGKDAEAKKLVNLLSLFMEQMEEVEKHPNMNRTVEIIRSLLDVVTPANIGGVIAYAVKLVGVTGIDHLNFITSDPTESGHFTEDILAETDQYIHFDSEYLQLVLHLLSYAAISHQNQKETVIQANILLGKIYAYILRNENIQDRQAVMIFLRYVSWIPPVTPMEETSYYYSYTTTTVLRQMDEIETEDPALQEQRKILMEYIAQLDPHLHAYMRQIHASLKGLFQITLKSSAGVNGYKKFVQLILSTKSYFVLEKKDEDWKLLIEYITNKYRRLRSFCRMLKDSALKSDEEMYAAQQQAQLQAQQQYAQQQYMYQQQQQNQDVVVEYEDYQDEDVASTKKRSLPFYDSQPEQQKVKYSYFK
ncbi:predicted protein [Naegleria gruberi]|uniref:Predicted protein n=1 Tax=Naegleria gruberi TaxID=5762 RepID=D2VLB1_NAEGR|nr:uncharacterized protein NAEGRDRAFT_50492 [Naegleria gruberi]EFC42355.1 predicted protein [Naegleria gruberi]|eukprot:XP_002675099.1 predicted protein [Naegleria gruberi strain NEG-M]